MVKSVHLLNGKLVSEEKLLISPKDLGFTRGYAVFDFFVTYPHHKPFKLKEHIDRLFHSASVINLHIPWSKKEIEQWVYKTLDANKDSSEKAVKIIVSGGVSGSLVPAKENITLIILVDPRPEYPEDSYTKGVGVITARHTRYSPDAKTNNYIEAVKQAQEAQKINAVETIYYNNSQVFEGSTSNVFALINGKLITPKSNILPGVTRNTLLEILKLNVVVAAKDFPINDLLSTKEVFLTGSNREVTPVTKIDGKKVGDGKVGPITKEVMRQFKEYTRFDKW